jgi:hypothetical protein
VADLTTDDVREELVRRGYDEVSVTEAVVSFGVSKVVVEAMLGGERWSASREWALESLAAESRQAAFREALVRFPGAGYEKA